MLCTRKPKVPSNAWKKRFAIWPTYVGVDKDGNRAFACFEFYEEKRVSSKMRHRRPIDKDSFSPVEIEEARMPIYH